MAAEAMYKSFMTRVNVLRWKEGKDCGRCAFMQAKAKCQITIFLFKNLLNNNYLSPIKTHRVSGVHNVTIYCVMAYVTNKQFTHSGLLKLPHGHG